MTKININIYTVLRRIDRTGMGLTEIKLVWYFVPEITHTNKNVKSETGCLQNKDLRPKT